MRFIFKLKQVAICLGLLALASAPHVAAQTVTISTASGITPGSNAVVTVSFTPGAQAVGQLELRFRFQRPPGVASGLVTATPGTAVCIGSATVSATGTELALARASFMPLAAETFCTFTIPTSSLASGNNPFEITFSEFTDPAGNTLPGIAIINGGINFASSSGNPNALAVPVIDEAGRVVFAGLILLLGLAVIGLRSRG